MLFNGTGMARTADFISQFRDTACRPECPYVWWVYIETFVCCVRDMFAHGLSLRMCAARQWFTWRPLKTCHDSCHPYTDRACSRKSCSIVFL